MRKKNAESADRSQGPATLSDEPPGLLAIVESDSTRIVFNISTYGREPKVDIRRWWRAADGTWRPTKAGVRLAEDQLEDFEKGWRLARAALVPKGRAA